MSFLSKLGIDIGPSLALHAVSSTPEDVPLWRREELWKVRDPTAREKAAMCEDFCYTFDRSDSCELNTAEQARYNALEPIFMRENHDQIGHRVWDGAMIMSKFLERCVFGMSAELSTSCFSAALVNSLKSGFAGMRVLEVGSGTGIVGMVAARLSTVKDSAPASFWATDIPAVIPQLATNIVRNNLQHIMMAEPLTWGNAEHEDALMEKVNKSGTRNLFDVIIASDLAAPESAAPALVSSLLRIMRACHSPPVLIVVSQLHREFTPAFRAALSGSAAFESVDIPSTAWHPDYTSERHCLWVSTLSTSGKL
jgi:predicted nicotinamide N-methyase